MTAFIGCLQPGPQFHSLFRYIGSGVRNEHSRPEIEKLPVKSVSWNEIELGPVTSIRK